MAAFEIKISETALPLLDRVRTVLRSGEIEKAMGQGTSNLIRSHLSRLSLSRKNKLGGQRTNFYGKAARSVNQKESPGVSIVSINWQGLQQRWLGGPISAGKSTSPVTGQPTKYLTIPAVAAAYGKRASELSDLHLLFGKSKKPYALANPSGQIYFKLKPMVSQDADPSVLPTEQEMADAAAEAANDKIELIIKEGRT